MSGARWPGSAARWVRPLALSALLLGLLALVWPLVTDLIDRGTAEGEEEGAIAVREASLRRQPASWLLDLHADIELSPEIRAGLASGVPLEFVLELELKEPRAFLPDATRLEAVRRYELTFYELTQHYRVRSVDDGGGRNYHSLPSALDGLGTLRGVELAESVDGQAAGEERRDAAAPSRPVPSVLDVELVLRLDQRALPLPLQSLVGAAWRLDSGRHAWRWTAPAKSADGTGRSAGALRGAGPEGRLVGDAS